MGNTNSSGELSEHIPWIMYRFNNLVNLARPILKEFISGTKLKSSNPFSNLENSKTSTQKHSKNHNLVVTQPALRRLVQLRDHLSKEPDVHFDRITKDIESIHSLIHKYGHNWPFQKNHGVQPIQKERIVVTGTTGSLGSYLLAQLLASDKIEKVWAVNRKSGKENRERQAMSFKDKLLDVNLLQSKKLAFVDANLEHPKLGLGDDTYNEASCKSLIRAEATVIIHNAWPVNFNLGLSSFEPNIRGTRNLLDLAFCSCAPTGPPRFAFASSITAAGVNFAGRRLNEVPIELEDAATSFGYGQSKVVVENLLESARRAGLHTCILRIGQLSGDAKNGYWSTTDWIPSIIKSSISLGYYPETTAIASWLPIDVAAQAIIDICVARDVGIELPPIVHISHPRPVRWSGIIHAFFIIIGYDIPSLPFDEWMKRIAEVSGPLGTSKRQKSQMFPVTKIFSVIDHAAQVDKEFRSRGSGSMVDAEFGSLVTLDTTVAQSLSEVLRFVPELKIEEVEKWVRYWESSGLFEPTTSNI